MEIDEPAEDCAHWELLEEMGLVAEGLTFFCVNSGPQAHHVYPNGDEVSNFEISTCATNTLVNRRTPTAR